MHNEMKDIDDISWHRGRGFQTNHMSKQPGKFLVWVFQGTYLNLGSTGVISWVDQIFIKELFSSFVLFEELLASSPLNCMVGVESRSILVNTEGAKEIGCCPWSWIILFSELNLSAHH
jgi:hypothetical protein